MLVETRAALLSVLTLSLLLPGCSSRNAGALAPAATPAAGSEPVAPTAVEPDADGQPLLLRAQDVDGSFDDRFGSGRFAVPYLASDAWMGAERPSVTLVSFIDYQCPYSRRLATTLYEIVERYTDDLRVVIKHLPLDMHANARLAAEAAVVAQRRGRFWQMHDALFEGQTDLGRPALARIAGVVGLSIPEMEAELDAHSAADAVARDLDLARALGVASTPTSFLNGRKVSGASELSELAAIVDEELALAAQLGAAGAKRHELYARVLHAAAAAPAPAPSPSPSPKMKPGEPDPALSYAVPVDDRPVRGPNDALVTVVMFGDFQCPFSKRALATLEALRKEEPTDVRIVFRHHPLPFHQQARDAARATIAAGAQGKFWQMHDLVFEHQRELDETTWRRLAKKLKLDLRRFERDMKAEATERTIAEDEAVAARFGSRATPAFFVNGRFISGAQPLDAFLRVVHEELPRARAHRDEARPADVYDSLIQGFVPRVDPAAAP